MTENAAPALQIRGLNKSFGNLRLLHNISLQLQPGQRLSIRGKSGCGKTTLLRIIAGIESAQSGDIKINGAVAMNSGKQVLQPWQRNTQLVFQDLGLWPTRSVLQNVCDPLRAAGKGKKEAEALAMQMLTDLGLELQHKKRPATLSGGEGRRLALARALVLKPALLLLDEPFTSLDPETREHSYQLLLQVLDQTETCIILVTHDPAEAAQLGGDCQSFEAGVLQS
ncbi:MAG: ATP-binding cassette domain-containing protein [Planctomycetes bacterium]|nr:ATP-binding cassette domain-containing protein [Planctomycetota bacterium]